MTQMRLAELADLNIRTIQKIEAGELTILVTTLVRIQKALNCPWNRLLPLLIFACLIAGSPFHP
ncbi:MAG: helix-turn-helix transcriptional regulator [Bdellovibrionaceae bacterium]|nr:helix-turn-helix transcriptional regulator [Pseudobdellovibrionaceae bacterium]